MYKKLLATMLAVTLASASLTACDPVNDSSPTAECHSSTKGPSGPQDGSGLAVTAPGHGNIIHFVSASVWAWCEPAPQEHHMTVEVWYEPIGSIENWHKLTDRTVSKIPLPIPTATFVTAACVPGDYQIRWHVTGLTSQGHIFTTDIQKGFSAEFTKQDCGIEPKKKK